jgi:hypothetical protein
MQHLCLPLDCSAEDSAIPNPVSLLRCVLVTPARPAHESGQAGLVKLFQDLDDPLHSERSVLAMVLRVHEAGQHPVAGPVMYNELLVGPSTKEVVTIYQRIGTSGAQRVGGLLAGTSPDA